MDIFSALQNRISANHFDHSHRLTDKHIDELVEAALQAPSAYNLQHTRFLAVTNAVAKQALQDIAYGQAKITAAAVTFIVLADLEAHRKLPAILEASVNAGIIEAEKATNSINTATRIYSADAVLARDEAIRSASMAAMALMLAATAKGWASCPMIGFNSKKLSAQFIISERYLPVMLIAVGLASDGNLVRKPRLPVDEILVRDVHPMQSHAFSH
ncbi:MAG TPA: nitroreductase family protein [Pseudomonadales bacterium]|nr:nitroreductase family protein [Pseudomonadales bacterium]